MTKDETVNKSSVNKKAKQKETNQFDATTSNVSFVPKPVPKVSDCIEETNWLLDNDINCFGEKLEFRHHSSCTYGYVPSYLYEWAAKRNFSSCLTYLHMLNTKHYYSFFIPLINSLEQGDHWFLAYVLFPTKTIMIMDSLRKNTEMYYKNHFMSICDLVAVVFESAGKSPDFVNWKLVVDSESYQQKNTFDCGIFVCLYMYSIMNNDYGYLSRLRKNRRDVVRRVLDEYPMPPRKIEHRYTYSGWQSYPSLDYTYEKGCTVIAKFESTLKSIKCVMCQQKIEGSKIRCIVCGNEAHIKCLSQEDRICYCEKEINYGSPGYKHPNDSEN